MEGLRTQEIIVVIILVLMVLGGGYTGRFFKYVWSMIAGRIDKK